MKDLIDKINAEKLDYIDLDNGTCLVADLDGIYVVNNETDERLTRVGDSWRQANVKSKALTIMDDLKAVCVSADAVRGRIDLTVTPANAPLVWKVLDKWGRITGMPYGVSMHGVDASGNIWMRLI